MKLLIVSIVMGFVGYSQALPLNGTVCNGCRVEWEDFSHMGGAGPGPNGLMHHAQLKIDGQVLERLEYYANAPFPVPVYEVDFDETTKKVIQKTGNSTSGSEIYTILISVEKIGNKIAPIEEIVKCTRKWAMLP